MASPTKYWLPKFDPAATFVVAAWPKGFTVNGVQPKPGEAFDKSSVSPRMLEEHYVKRWIAVAEAPDASPVDPTPSLGVDVASDRPAHRSPRRRRAAA